MQVLRFHEALPRAVRRDHVRSERGDPSRGEARHRISLAVSQGIVGLQMLLSRYRRHRGRPQRPVSGIAVADGPAGLKAGGMLYLPHFMTAEMKLSTRASRVPQLFTQDTVVRSRSRR